MLAKRHRKRKRPVGKSWRVDETYNKVKGQREYLYRAVDKAGNTIDFLLRAHRDKAAAKRYVETAIAQNGEPEMATIEKVAPIWPHWNPAMPGAQHRSRSVRRST